MSCDVRSRSRFPVLGLLFYRKIDDAFDMLHDLYLARPAVSVESLTSGQDLLYTQEQAQSDGRQSDPERYDSSDLQEPISTQTPSGMRTTQVSGKQDRQN